MKHSIQGLIIGNTINFAVDSNLYKKTCSTEEAADAFYDALVEAQKNPTDEAVENLLSHLNQTMRIAKENGLEYDVETGDVFLKGFSTPLPELLVNTIEKAHAKGRSMESMINFWKLLMINPDKRVRKSLFDFIATHDFSITRNGYMVVYKAVEYFDENNTDDLNTFVTNAAFHVRNDWKCSPSKYAVYQDASESYHITKETTINNWDLKEKGITYMGNLLKLEKSSAVLSAQENAVKFIPKHVSYNRSNFDINKETIRLGVPQQMERQECDSDPTIDCSYGLHVGATKYVKSFAGKTSAILTCLVNPAHVIAVPEYDHSKMRVCEYFPYALNERKDDGSFTVVEQPYFESDYLAYEKQELERQIAAIQDEEDRVGVDVHQAADDRNIEEVLKTLQSRVVDLETV